MRTKEIIRFVEPLYRKKDSMHNFSHILRIRAKVARLRKGYSRIDDGKLWFLIYFHGLKGYVQKHKQQILRMGFPKSYLRALYRHTTKPESVEEKLVSDANLLEAVGKFGIRKALQAGKERKQTTEETLRIMLRNINKAKFYTKEGKRVGNPRIKISREFLDRCRVRRPSFRKPGTQTKPPEPK
ncbi:MAG: hypothetical protein AB1657_02600 [Candidatus Micrarchaeota archaeon]